MLNTEMLPQVISDLPYQEENIKQIFTVFQSLLPSWPEINLVIGGVSGTGKSACLQLIERHFADQQLIQSSVFTTSIISAPAVKFNDPFMIVAVFSGA